MESIESMFDAAISAKVIQGAVLAARSTDESYTYLKAFGSRASGDGDGDLPMELDALFWMGSCTKLLTAISVLQCVDRGDFTLDEDVTTILPELRDIEIRMPAPDTPDGTVLVKAKNKITLRHLLTHTSGLSYTRFGNFNLPLIERCLSPLVFEPGDGFIYGTGADFAGFMVERVSGLTLEKYVQRHIAEPLGVNSICFHPRSYPELFEKFTEVSLRKERPGPVEWTSQTIWPLEMVGNSGGSGAYATVADYQKVMHSITRDDGRLLPSHMVDELFRPVMTPAVRESIKRVLEDENTNNIYGGIPARTEVSYAIGGMVMLEDLPGRRPKGAMYWGALLNTFFWMDRTNGLSGIYGSQVFPAGDPQCLHLFAEFERKVYEDYRVSHSKV